MRLTTLRERGMPTKPLRLITIDLDDTVWPCAPVIERAEHAQYQWLEREAAALTAVHDVDSLRAHRRRLKEQRPDLAHDFTALRIASLRTLLEEHGHLPELAEEATRVFLRTRNCVEPYDDVPGALETLGQSYTLVSVTNGNADIRQTPLGDHFHHSVSAATAGAAKPAPHIFTCALQYAGVAAEQAIHVGDDPELDVEAARRVGMATVWVNRARAAWPGHVPPPNAVVGDLGELVQWLESDSAASAPLPR